MQMFRHGTRTVIYNYTNDPNQNFWNEYGMGQMVPEGMKQLQDFGMFFRAKYASFLNATYSSDRVYAKSTDFDRTLQSTMCFLSGVFVPARDQVWTTVAGQMSWMPIAVHTNNLQTDNVINHNDKLI